MAGEGERCREREEEDVIERESGHVLGVGRCLERKAGCLEEARRVELRGLGERADERHGWVAETTYEGV